MTGGAGHDPIRRRDEILQVMYWLRGEGLGESITSGELVVFLDPSASAQEAVEADLRAMVAAGLLEPAGAGRYRLSELGVAEGGRRFADEFAGLTLQGHGACSDPDCDCHVEGPEACVRNR